MTTRRGSHRQHPGRDDRDRGGAASGGTLVFGTTRRPGRARRRARLGRRVAPPDRPDLRDARLARARHDRARARSRLELGDLRRRPGLHVHAPGGRHVPRRRAVQRRGGLLQLRPLVQLQGLVPEPERLVLLADGLRRLRDDRAGQRRTGGELLQELRGRRRQHGHDQPDEAVVRDPRRALAVELRDREPEGADGVRRRRGQRRRRGRVPSDRHVRHRAPDRHRARSSSSRGRAATASCSPATTTTGARRR